MVCVCYGNVGTLPCTSQCSLKQEHFLVCIIDLVDLICVGWQCNVCGVITAVVFSRRRFFDITFLLISLD